MGPTPRGWGGVAISRVPVSNGLAVVSISNNLILIIALINLSGLTHKIAITI